MIAIDHRLVCLVATLSLVSIAHAQSPAFVCEPSADARAVLVRDTARLARAARPRNVLRAGSLLEDIDAVCEATRVLHATCPSRLVVPVRAVTRACERATAQIETAIELEDAIREGRRALRGLDADEQGRDYPELVGAHEYAQGESLRAFPALVEAFGARLAELEAAAAQEVESATTATAIAALRVVSERLEALATTTSRALTPPRSTRRPPR